MKRAKLELNNNFLDHNTTEKRKPTCDLIAFKAACVDADKLNVTGAAVRSAAALGFGREDIATIQTMQREHFYKSITNP